MSQGSEIDEADLSGPVVDRRTTTALLGAAGVGAFAGCASTGGPSEGTDEETDESASPTDSSTPAEDTQGGRLQAGWFTGEIEVLDPPYISVGQYFQVAANIFNGLVTLTPDLTIRGDLANDWEVTNNGATFTFDLREGVTFHNGDEFTAEDVRFTIQRTISQETPAAPKLSTLEPVDNGGVVVEDSTTVTLEFEQPLAPALVYLTRGPGRAATIVNQTAIEEMGEQYRTEPVGTGPFAVRSHELGSELILDAHDDYFETDENGTQLPYLDGVDITPIPEAAQVVNALRSGDIQFSNLVPLQNVSQVEDAGSVEKIEAPGVNWLGLAMNQNREPFGSRKARRGIAKLIDTEEYVQTAYFGNALADTGPINKATAWVWREDKPSDQDYAPEEGMRLLEEAGAADASFSLLTAQGDLRAAKALRQQLNRAGLNVEIDQVTSSTYWDRFPALDYDATISGSVGDPDPDQSLWNFYRKTDDGGVWNWTVYENDTVNELLAEQRRTLDREQRATVLHELENQLIADAPHAFLAHRSDIAARRSEVRGYQKIPFLRNFHTVSVQ